MNASKVIAFAPTVILLAFLGYSAYSLQSALPGASEKKDELSKGLDLMLQDIVTASRDAKEDLDRMRDPFLPVRPPEEVKEVAPETAALPESDGLAEIIAGLSLDATFLQGKDQLAIINGRIYHKGQSLDFKGNDDKTKPSLVVVYVKPTSVLLRGGGKNYVLGYPERFDRKPSPAAEVEAGTSDLENEGQAAMFRRLLNSPLGAMGKSLIGNAATPGRSGSSRAGSRRNPAGTRTSDSVSP
jgi:hypothetical protein